MQHLHYHPHTSRSHVPLEWWRQSRGGSENHVFRAQGMPVLRRSPPLITEWGKKKLFVPPFITLIDKTELGWRRLMGGGIRRDGAGGELRGILWADEGGREAFGAEVLFSEDS